MMSDTTVPLYSFGELYDKMKASMGNSKAQFGVSTFKKGGNYAGWTQPETKVMDIPNPDPNFTGIKGDLASKNETHK